MWGTRYLLFLLFGLMSLGALSACGDSTSGGGGQFTPSAENISPTDKAILTGEVTDSASYPDPSSNDPQVMDQAQIYSAYPYPDAISENISGTNTPYPAPRIENETQTTSRDTAYPAPGQDPTLGTPHPIATSTKAVSSSVSPSSTVESSTLLPTQQVGYTATPLDQNTTPQEIATQPILATQTPTPSLVRTQLQASDPSTFQLSSGQVQFVEFFAFWSPMSQSMAPIVFRLEDQFEGRVNFVYLDIDDPENGLFKQLIDDRLPPIFFLVDENGNVLGEWRGYVGLEILRVAIENALQ